MLKHIEIQVGDLVWVRYSELISDYRGFILHIPQDVGDMWHIETKDEVIAVNPMCSILLGIYKAKDNVGG